MQLTIQAASIWVCTHPVDFRKSIDGLMEVVMSGLTVDVKNHIFLFHNRSRDKIKLLAFIRANEGDKLSITQQQLSWLLAGLDWINMSEWGELEYNDYR